MSGGARVARSDPQRQPGAARGRLLALFIAVAAHVAILAGLVLGVSPAIPSGGPAITEVTLLPHWPSFSSPPSPDRKPAAKRRRAQGESTPAVATAPPVNTAPVTTGAAATGPSAAGDLARLGAALRASGIGCGLEGARLTPAEREACHERLGAGAADAAYITAVSPEKRSYYAALQDSEAKLAHDRLGGHAPGIVCGKGAQTRGFKLGDLPCAFSPSPSPWAPELDVRPP